MSRAADRFHPLQRWLHWTMAAALLAMLVIGVVMASSLTLRPALLAIHRPLGMAIGVLALLRLVVRLRCGTPSLPDDLPRWQVLGAHASHIALYALMLAMPLLGWAMLSAGGMPVTLWPGVLLPPLLPFSPAAYAVLQPAHQLAAWSLAALVLAHIGAALHHAWIRRDGVWQAMAGGRRR